MAFRVGDRVEVTAVGRFWGEGEIVEISKSSHGGSKLYPVFMIETDDGTSGWFPAISLTQIRV